MKRNVGVCFNEGADNLFDMPADYYFNYYLKQSRITILLSWCYINNSKLLRKHINFVQRVKMM